jgi:hypothetical protein
MQTILNNFQKNTIGTRRIDKANKTCCYFLSLFKQNL